MSVDQRAGMIRLPRGAASISSLRSSVTSTDRLGLALVLLCAGWTLFSSTVSGGDPVPVLGLLLLSTSFYAAARVVGEIRSWLPPIAVVLLAMSLFVVYGTEVFDDHGLSQPFGYANAKGAFFVQAAIAAAMVAVAIGPGILRTLVVASAVAFAIVPFAAESSAAAVLVTVMIPAVFLGRRFWSQRVFLLALGMSFLVVLGATIILGAASAGGVRTGPVGDALVMSLSVRRPAYWGETLEMMTGRPITGVGPGRFHHYSIIAQADLDDGRWAHSGFLQQGAETGVIGLIALAGLFVWGLVRIGALDSTVAALGAVSVATLGIHACIDYVLHFPHPVAAAAILAGAATANPGQRSP